jgi:hypothetical protein
VLVQAAGLASWNQTLKQRVAQQVSEIELSADEVIE